MFKECKFVKKHIDLLWAFYMKINEKVKKKEKPNKIKNSLTKINSKILTKEKRNNEIEAITRHSEFLLNFLIVYLKFVEN